jgi:hypothetical protein
LYVTVTIDMRGLGFPEGSLDGILETSLFHGQSSPRVVSGLLIP